MVDVVVNMVGVFGESGIDLDFIDGEVIDVIDVELLIF